MQRKGVKAADIITVMLMLPKNHPARELLINLMNTALVKGVLPQKKEDVFHIACKELIKEGWL